MALSTRKGSGAAGAAEGIIAVYQDYGVSVLSNLERKLALSVWSQAGHIGHVGTLETN